MQGSYPLDWPDGWERCKGPRQQAAFKTITLERAQTELKAELRRMGAQLAILSTNIRLRGDGLPYSNQRVPDDPGCAVYFTFKTRRLVLACDRWAKLEHNVRAIAKHIETLRAQERWGVGSIEQAFTGYLTLPAAVQDRQKRPWRDVLQFTPVESVWPELIANRFRQLSLQLHPDQPGGSPELFQELVRAREDAIAATVS